MKTPARLGRKAGAGDAGGQLALLPEPPFSPIWPQSSTLAARLLDILLSGRTQTHPQFEALTFSWRLSAVVFELRELGWPVLAVDISAPTQACPDRIIAKYWLDPNIIAQARLLRRGRDA
jgi:hypothetical protein